MMGVPFPREELEVINTVISMFTDPVLGADVDMLAKLWEDEARRKQARLAELDVTEADLQSAERFAQLLRDCGIEPEMKDGPVSQKTGKSKRNYAFAKTDQFMRDLQEHQDERVQTLAEARLGVKSTLLQTRAETLGFMAGRGNLPVYLRYAGAGTLRVSGGDGANWLNFKRGSDIRKSILAPEGYLLAPIDSSQIECRVLHYLAGGPDEPVIKKFRNKEDPYVDLASKFYGERIYKPGQDDPRKDEMEAKRGMGKQGRLMCLGPNTKVLTDRGTKRIVDVTTYDRVWDGVEWVDHQGLIFQGVRDVENFLGVEMTADHRVLCGQQGWLQALHLRNANIQSRALAEGSANLPSQASNSAQREDCLTSSLGAHAKLKNIRSILQICLQAARRAAPNVRLKLWVFGSKNITATLTFAQTRSIELAFWGAFPLYTGDAASAQSIRILPTTEDEESVSMQNGEKIAALSWRTWFRYRVGTIRSFLLTASKITRVMFQVICNLLPQNNKPPTGAAYEICRKKSLVFDLVSAGPRNRFTIFSDKGPLIVHNCGYGAAGPKFKITAKNGLYGPPVDIPIEDANAFVKLYREDNPSICAKNTGYWAQCGRVLARLAGGDPMEFGPLTIRDKRIYLPEGQPLIYDTLEYFVPEPEDKHLYGQYARDGHWRVRTRNGWKELWGSKLVQNICEAVSRVIVSQAMCRITRMGYRVLNWPYDELLILIPKDGHEVEHAERCKAEMLVTPSWLPGLPLDAEYTLAERYSK